MPASFVVVPQWQGSGSSRAMRLIDGAEAIRGDLPSGATRTVDVPLGAGDSLGTAVHRASVVATVRERLRDVLAETPDGATPIVIGGDCGVELGAVDHALGHSPGMALVWFDAHGDLNSPRSSPSGAFCGMVLRALLGEAPEPLLPTARLAADRVVLAGSRELDPDEERLVGELPVQIVDADALAEPDALADAVAATGADSVYVHIDLDVLDPEDVRGIDTPVPFGVRAAHLVAAVRALTARVPLAGAGIAQFAPASPVEARDDLPTILRILSALTAASRA